VKRIDIISRIGDRYHIGNTENGEFSYVKALNSVGKDNIKLPILKNSDETPVIDSKRQYSAEGFIPDWRWMEDYIKSLRHKSISTKLTFASNADLKTIEWKEFLLKDLFNAGMGNGIDAVKTTKDNPQYNYVSRDSNGNGVVDFVDVIEGEELFPAGTMSSALGGSFLGSCFIQKKPFYTAQNVAVLQGNVGNLLDISDRVENIMLYYIPSAGGDAILRHRSQKLHYSNSRENQWSKFPR
jgi:hypothetical protein